MESKKIFAVIHNNSILCVSDKQPEAFEAWNNLPSDSFMKDDCKLIEVKRVGSYYMPV